MNSQDLFNSLKIEAEFFSMENLAKKNLSAGHQLIAKYDLEMFFEIKNRDHVDNIEAIDSDVLQEFSFCIDRYMDENAPGQTDFKKYVRIVSIYLTFIVKKPLHPPGMIFSGGEKIISKDNYFYCPLKNKQLNQELSLCKYCVSKDISEKK